MTTGVSSWRQLSLGSLATSSGGLPTILTEKSPRKVPEDHTVRECAEPEPAPSPDQRSLDQRSLPTQPMDLCFARAGPVQPALVLSIPGMPGRVGTSGSAYSCDSEELRPDSREYRELWEAVLEGNLAQLEDLLARGLLNGRLCDVNGHSIFWNALAHQQVQVAMFLLHRFPPGGPRGIDLSEVHAKRGDTLLHLCVYLHHFSAPAAELFQSLFGSRPGWDAESLQAYRCRGNAELETVAHCAAARLNFWVLRFLAARELPLLFLRNRYGLTAVEVLLQKLQDANVSCPLLATLPLSEAEMARPAWTDFTAYLPGRSQSFADLELEVQDETSGSCRVRAHRAILAAASGVLHQQLLDLPAGRPLLIDPLCCRSRKVLEMALTFLYCSQLSCDFAEDGFRLWQLLCLCATFHLPEPLWRFAKSAMLRTLGNPEFAAVAAVALEAREEIHLSGPEVCFVAHALLRSPEAALRKWPTEQQRQAEIDVTVALEAPEADM
ncbi:unnamed protein product [Effrenium voratum]|uniref:BTB domain-containing protein n=1 Tax=Effrenium voratum TaxID=2562239 RepID=A0AA36NEF2_9DINO|nr:unnamed protein product [Effrenium voratum]